jgi:hypothetical protein
MQIGPLLCICAACVMLFACNRQKSMHVRDGGMCHISKCSLLHSMHSITHLHSTELRHARLQYNNGLCCSSHASASAMRYT